MADATQGGSSGSFLQKLNSYVRTRKGTLLTGEIVLSVVIIICYAASHYGGFSTIPVVELVLAILFFLIFMNGLDAQIRVVNWVWSDFLRALIGGVLYLIIGLICLINGAADGARIAGGVFSLLASIVFGYDTYFTFRTIKSSSSTENKPASTDEFA